VDALIETQRRMKEAAEENSHALKTPLAVIAQSVEPIRRVLPSTDGAAARALVLIERSVARLDAMVSAQRDLDDSGADLIYPVRQPMDFSEFLTVLLKSYEATLAVQGKRLRLAIAPDLMAYTNEDAMEPVVENLLENAASFTPVGGLIDVVLHIEGGSVCLRVLDRGPGVDPSHLPHIFERAASFRKDGVDDLASNFGHQGLGLWIVRRNVESLGGSVAARNRAQGGFEISVCLPGND
jgi:two-component system sensor histidine kinase ChvG